MRDEGTLFSQFNSLNATTTDQVEKYFKQRWWPAVSDAQLDRLMELYPGDPTQGSPDGTGLLYTLPPQYKRIAAITGDYSFEAQRRQLLAQHMAPKWNYFIETSVPSGPSLIGSLLGSTGLTDIPVLGSFHSSDVIFYAFGTISDTISQNSKHIMGMWISFVNNRDPNKHGMSDVPNWPQWDVEKKQTIHFREQGVDVIEDDYREAQMDYINEIADSVQI